MPLEDMTWSQGLDEESKTLIAAKGWRSAADILKSYSSLERMLGSDKIALPGKTARPEDWASVWERLGRPKDPSEYALARPEGYEGYSDDMAGWFRKIAHEAGLNGTQAGQLHDAFVSYVRGMEQAYAEKAAAETASLDYDLQKEWGSDYAANLELARRGAAAFIDRPEELDALEQGIGGKAMMRLFQRIGSSMAETPMIGAGLESRPEATGDAKAEITRIQGEAASNPKHPLFDNTHPEHKALVEKMERLFRQAYPESSS